MLRKPEAWVRLREHLAKQPDEKFNMSHFWCGTAGCLAGHAVLMEDGKVVLGSIENLAIEILGIENRAIEILGLKDFDYEEYVGENDHVFSGDWKLNKDSLSQITRQEALEYLDKVIEKQDVFVVV